MTRRAARCTQSDIARALRAVEGSATPKAVEILPDGTIRIRPAPANDSRRPGSPVAPRKDIVL